MNHASMVIKYLCMSKQVTSTKKNLWILLVCVHKYTPENQLFLKCQVLTLLQCRPMPIKKLSGLMSLWMKFFVCTYSILLIICNEHNASIKITHKHSDDFAFVIIIKKKYKKRQRWMNPLTYLHYFCITIKNLRQQFPL